MAFDWVSLLRVAVLAALSSNAKTAPIANEVADASAEAEQIFTEHGSGSQKLQHVLHIAANAAQATDELKGFSKDDVAGPVSQAVAAGVAATNAIKGAVDGFKSPTVQ